jgi:hypothetical protein
LADVREKICFRENICFPESFRENMCKPGANARGSLKNVLLLQKSVISRKFRKPNFVRFRQADEISHFQPIHSLLAF